jgi:hypothetical protein
MAREMNLTHETLVELLDFDPATGVFTWKVARSNRVKPGSRAGVKHIPSGGRYISISGEKIMAHRLAWFYVHQTWPELEIRPVDGDYDNCAITNLKEISRVDLAHKRTKQQNNTSGYLGVSKTVGGKWQAILTWNYKQFSLGANFETPETAHEAREEAVRRFQGKSTQAEYNHVMEELRVWKGQKTAWRFLHRDHHEHAWSSFEAFCENVTFVPKMRYAMVPLDASKPIGPGNFDWAFPPEASRHTPDGIVSHNKARRERQGDHTRDKDFRRKYGITFAEYQSMFDRQKGLCLICEKPSLERLAVDHNHDTKVVRALLCKSCNYALGQFGDDLKRLRGAVRYLENYESKSNVIPFDLAALNGVIGFGA